MGILFFSWWSFLIQILAVGTNITLQTRLGEATKAYNDVKDLLSVSEGKPTEKYCKNILSTQNSNDQN